MASALRSDVDESSFVDTEERDSFTFIEAIKGQDTEEVHNPIVLGEDSESEGVYASHDGDQINVVDANEEQRYFTSSYVEDQTMNKNGNLGYRDGSIQIIPGGNESEHDDDDSIDNGRLIMSIDEIIAQERKHLECIILVAQVQNEKLQSTIAGVSSCMEIKERGCVSGSSGPKEVSKTSTLKPEPLEAPNELPRHSFPADEESIASISSDEPEHLNQSMSSPSNRKQKSKRNTYGANGIDMQTFIKDYYHSLNSISRFIIIASMTGFFTAFVLLSLYSSQTHEQDMKRFKLEEEKNSHKQSYFEKVQERYENFRESLIHQRYEETRQCHNTLQTCYIGKEEFQKEVAKMEEEANVKLADLQRKLEIQQDEIQILKTQNTELLETNKKMEKELRKASTVFSQILVSFLEIWRNKGVQAVVAGIIVLTVVNRTFPGPRAAGRCG